MSVRIVEGGEWAAVFWLARRADWVRRVRPELAAALAADVARRLAHLHTPALLEPYDVDDMRRRRRARQARRSRLGMRGAA